MKMLISIEYAKRHLRIDHDADDSDIELKIAGASDALIRYLKEAAKEFINDSGDIMDDKVPDGVKCAALQLVGMLYKDRDGGMMGKWVHGYLPFAVTSLIYDMRKPSVA